MFSGEVSGRVFAVVIQSHKGLLEVFDVPAERTRHRLDQGGLGVLLVEPPGAGAGAGARDPLADLLQGRGEFLYSGIEDTAMSQRRTGNCDEAWSACTSSGHPGWGERKHGPQLR